MATRREGNPRQLPFPRVFGSLGRSPFFLACVQKVCVSSRRFVPSSLVPTSSVWSRRLFFSSPRLSPTSCPRRCAHGTRAGAAVAFGGLAQFRRFTPPCSGLRIRDNRRLKRQAVLLHSVQEGTGLFAAPPYCRTATGKVTGQFGHADGQIGFKDSRIELGEEA